MEFGKVGKLKKKGGKKTLGPPEERDKELGSREAFCQTLEKS